MKTSNKLLLAVLVVLLSTLAAYNMALKTEYATGSYKDPYRHHNALAMEAFEDVEVNGSHLLSVNIVSGDKHEVYLQKDTEETVTVKQEGKRLIVDVALTDRYNQVRGWKGPHVIIQTPNLRSLRTDAVHTLNGKPVTNLDKTRSPQYYLVKLMGLKQDNLTLELDKGSNVALHESQIGNLQVTLGSTPGSQSLLQLLPNNTVRAAQLDIRNKSHLMLQDLSIPDLRYTFSDSARLELSGASLALVRQ